ncbi:PspC domain-containing protein [Sphingomonas morindae]|uniref:PspC domain-containing protein n=1 Tax=Sphingomonas morindae TaxID=1541170 RepID=A0ABY4X5T0_9SPHN|nr:PspC domain-containing protein [Sphingomonas morindae]USI72234.1 PspC domain-containing protein [Sphingomonas morindae]
MTGPVAASPAATAGKDNLVGICHGLGQDLGLNPFFLRIVLALLLLVSAKVALIAYGLCGLTLLLSRAIGALVARLARRRAATSGVTPRRAAPRLALRARLA